MKHLPSISTFSLAIALALVTGPAPSMAGFFGPFDPYPMPGPGVFGLVAFGVVGAIALAKLRK